MLTKLVVQGFKSWRDSGRVRLAPITALFGPNSSGKSSLLQLLLLLKQTADSPDRSQVLNLGDERTPVELGTFQDILYRHDLSQNLFWQLDWTLPQRLVVPSPERPNQELFSDDRLGFSARIAVVKGNDGLGRAHVDRMMYRFAESDFGMSATTGRRRDYELFEDRADFRFIRTPGRVWSLPAPAKCYGFPDQVRAYYQNAAFLSDFELRFEELFARLFYLGPLREYPKRQYSWSGALPLDVGLRGERVIDALLASREAGHTISMGRGRKALTLEERVAKWLMELGLIRNFEVRAITPGGKLFQVWVKKSDDASEVLVTDVGFGVSQILPVIALCYYVPEGSVVLLEQPEIHLHPSVQAGLADVFIDAVKTRHIQLIVESHSEHLLRRLQRRIAEEGLHAEDTALYFCSSLGGESKLTTLELDIFGSIKNWPKDFFGDEFGEISAMQDAMLKRKKSAT